LRRDALTCRDECGSRLARIFEAVQSVGATDERDRVAVVFRLRRLG
jgi:hypothetical protein